ncbi:hypothetical protein BGZ50_000738 [Haplosporangium sp. Z 11]|nr:hypothetical protein BGZ50_000738 [Haplosporangium sp. Z 11]
MSKIASDCSLYHEVQTHGQCGKHTLNNLLQGPVFSTADLDAIAECLCRITQENLQTVVWKNPYKSPLGMGFYDVSVLEAALAQQQCTLSWFDARHNIADCLSEQTESMVGLIAHVPTSFRWVPFWKGQHWFGILRLSNGEFIDMDSRLSEPVALGGFQMRKKNRTHKKPDESENPNAPKIPKTFVMRSGEVGHSVMGLVGDIRRLMEPNTATKLRERKNNRLRDFVAVAGPLGVTHFVILSRTDHGTNMRIARLPRGPTLSFQVKTYSLAKDIAAMQKAPKSPGLEFHMAPLLVLNNFGDSNEMKLMSTVFQNMFPPINIQTMQLADARRVVLLNYNSETKNLDFRHYNISIKPVGISKSIKRVITTDVPDLQGFDDISDYVLRGAFASESDVEDGPEATVTLGQDYVGRNNRKQDQRAIKLVELGPRMELKLVKIQAGMCDGEVLYHDFIKRSPEELKAQKTERNKKLQEKAARRKAQELNVAKKKAEKAAAKEAHRLATGGAPRQPDEEENEDEDMDNKDANGKRKRSDDGNDGDDSDVAQEDQFDDDSDNYSDMGDMAPQFSDEDEGDYSGEDNDHMEGFSDDE